MKAFSTILIISLFSIFTLTSCENLNNEKTYSLDYSHEKGYIEVDQGKLYYQTFGSGDPIIVLHGGPGLDQEILLPQMMKLSKDHKVIFYDQRGSGKSSSQTLINSQTINMEKFIEDLELLRQKFNLNKFTLIGHSWGGFLAMNYAIKHSKHLSSLILLNSGPADYKGSKAFIAEFAKRSISIKDAIEPMFSYENFSKLNQQQINNLYKTLFSIYLLNPEDINKLSINFNLLGARSGIKVIQEMSKCCFLTPNVNLFPALKKLKIPTLILHGSDDIVPLWTAKEIHRSLLNSKLVIIKNSGHFSYVEQPDLTFSEINFFLK